jgi:hypothetical protein
MARYSTIFSILESNYAIAAGNRVLGYIVAATGSYLNLYLHRGDDRWECIDSRHVDYGMRTADDRQDAYGISGGDLNDQASAWLTELLNERNDNEDH